MTTTRTMTQPAPTGLPFDPTDPKFREDPYPTYEELRRHTPLAYLEVGDGAWVVSRHADCRAVLRDPAMGMTSSDWLVPLELADGAAGRIFPNLLTFTDGRRHARMRRLVASAFTPRAITRLERRIEEIVDSLLDRAEQVGAIDVMSELAFELPVLVICDLLGIPADDRQAFKEWTPDFSRIFESGWSTPEEVDACHRATDALCAYLERHVEKRRRRPGDEILDALIAAHDGGEHLTHDELIALSVQLLNAGYETTMGLIGNAVHALLRHPDQAERLRQEPGRISTAIEEVLRWDPPVQYTGRVALEPFHLHGECIPTGDTILTLLGAANRDPALYESPDRFDVSRSNVEHLGFGFGAHFCVGAHLARIEARTAVGRMLARFPEMVAAGPPPRHRPSFLFRTLTSLRVEISREALVR